MCHGGCHAGFASNERLYQLIFTDYRRGKEKNLSLKSAGHNENQLSRSLRWHMIAHRVSSVAYENAHVVGAELIDTSRFRETYLLFFCFFCANPHELHIRYITQLDNQNTLSFLSSLVAPCCLYAFSVFSIQIRDSCLVFWEGLYKTSFPNNH